MERKAIGKIERFFIVSGCRPGESDCLMRLPRQRGQNDSLTGLEVIVIFDVWIEFDDGIQQRRCAAVESLNAYAGK